ncbi:MAG: lipopolysaccharide heptosyltransferase II [Deltaproteobacteria bacterium]|nr:lipopolysaccharide heptosyltransferase II [Deltaproteobacteria bacterium]
MKVLIIKLSSIGDCVHTLPALHALRKGLDKAGVKARIDWLVEEAASGVLKGNPLIDNLIVVKRGWAKNFGDNRKTARLLASTGYDMVLDFQGLLKSGVWVMLSRGKKRAGFSNGRELSHLFLNDRLPPYDIERHAVERYLDLAAHAGGDTSEVKFPLHIPKAFVESAIKKIEKGGIKKGSPFFVLIPRARWETKLWDDGRFIELAKRVISKSGIPAVLAGGPSDRAALEAIKEKIGEGACNLSGQTDLLELAAVLKMARFAVTVDSGPMHLAAAVGTRTVALFGPTAPWRTGPYGKGHIIVRKGLKCSPCFKKKCTDPKCMKEISVDDVMAAVEEVLKGDRA